MDASDSPMETGQTLISLDTPVVIPANEKPRLVLKACYIAEIDPQACGPLVEVLGEALPLGTLQHAKRVYRRPGSQNTLDILICPAIDNHEKTVEIERVVSGESTKRHRDDEEAKSVGTEILSTQKNEKDAAESPEQKTTRIYIPIKDIPNPAQTILRNSNLETVYITGVPFHAPRTKEDRDRWSKYWPVSLRAPDKHMLRDSIHLSQKEIESMKQHMMKVWDLSQVNCLDEKGKERVRNACVIVDPSSNKVIAHGVDETHAHPLHHAVMVAIENVADWQRKTFYNTEKEKNHVQDSKKIENGVSTTSGVDDRVCDSIQWNQGTIEVSQDSTNCVENSAVQDSHRKFPSNTQQNNVANISNHSSAKRAMHERPYVDLSLNSSEKQLSKRCRQSKKATSQSLTEIPYLCTGYDCYVLHEPCWMCAMALVHSRLRRVIFSISDKRSGGLGGSGHRLHSQRNLNHHYSVFQIPIIEQGD